MLSLTPQAPLNAKWICATSKLRVDGPDEQVAVILHQGFSNFGKTGQTDEPLASAADTCTAKFIAYWRGLLQHCHRVLLQMPVLSILQTITLLHITR
jgi:hypothetical protein